MCYFLLALIFFASPAWAWAPQPGPTAGRGTTAAGTKAAGRAEPKMDSQAASATGSAAGTRSTGSAAGTGSAAAMATPGTGAGTGTGSIAATTPGTAPGASTGSIAATTPGTGAGASTGSATATPGTGPGTGTGSAAGTGSVAATPGTGSGPGSAVGPASTATVDARSKAPEDEETDEDTRALLSEHQDVSDLMLYMGIGIGVLLILVLVVRMASNRSPELDDGQVTTRAIPMGKEGSERGEDRVLADVEDAILRADEVPKRPWRRPAPKETEVVDSAASTSNAARFLNGLRYPAMRRSVSPFFTQAAQTPFFSGSSFPHFGQRVRSISSGSLSSSPLISCRMPSATSANLGIIERE